MKKDLTTGILFCFLVFIACDNNKITPPEQRPEGWIALGLDNLRVNRLVLAGDWLYACANQEGLYRIKHPASQEDQWQFLGLDDARILAGNFGVKDVITLDDTIVVGNFGNFSPDIPGVYRSIDDGNTWTSSDSGFIRNQIYQGRAFVQRLVQSPFDSNMLLAGCSSAFLVYLSRDFGRSWEMIFDLFDGEISFHTAGFHPNRQNEIWVGGRVPNSQRPLLYRSPDLGANWEELLKRPNPYNPPGDNVKAIAFDLQDDNTVYVCSEWAILKTNDNGNSWSTSDSLGTGLSSMSLNPFDNQELVVCALDSLYLSLDGFQSWQALAGSPVDVETSMMVLAMDWQRRILYVGTFNSQSSARGIYSLYF